jgi:hypothetical protein
VSPSGNKAEWISLRAPTRVSRQGPKRRAPVSPVHKRVLSQTLDALVEPRIDEVLPVGPRGKRQAVWTGLGYALGKSEVSVIAFHDADVLTYDRGFLLRLLFPVVRLRYQFSKGFYARYSDRLHGRVVIGRSR